MRLVLLLNYACCVVLASKMAGLLSSLSKGMEARSHLIFLDAPYDAETEKVLQLQQDAPRFLIATQRVIKKYERFETNILTIVFLDDVKTRQQQQLQLFRYTVAHCKHCLVIFVSNMSYATNVRWLFEWCWKNHFTDVLLISSRNVSVLTTYTPFPQLELYNTTLSMFLKENKRRLFDFKGYPIRFWSSLQIPRCMVYENEKGELVLKGLLARSLKIFASKVNASLQRVIRSTNQSYDDCIHLLKQDKIDICLQLFYVDRTFHFTRPTFLHKLHLLVRNAHPLPIFKCFPAPFSFGLWLMIAFSIIILTLILGLVCWYRYSIWCIDHIFIQILASVLYLPFRLPQFSGRTQPYLHLLLFAFGFVISMLYLAFLSSFFNTNIYEKKIESIADLKAHNISILEDADEIYILRYYEVNEALFERVFKVPTSVMEYHMLTLDPNFAYTCALDKCDLLLEQQKFMLRPKMIMINSPTALMWAGMPIENNTFFEVLYNDHLQRLFESGLHQYNVEKSFDDAVELKFLQYHNTEEHQIVVKPLNIEYFYLPATVLIIGHLIALMAFMAELIVHRYWN